MVLWERATFSAWSVATYGIEVSISIRILSWGLQHIPDSLWFFGRFPAIAGTLWRIISVLHVVINHFRDRREKGRTGVPDRSKSLVLNWAAIGAIFVIPLGQNVNTHSLLLGLWTARDIPFASVTIWGYPMLGLMFKRMVCRVWNHLRSWGW